MKYNISAIKNEISNIFIGQHNQNKNDYTIRITKELGFVRDMYRSITSIEYNPFFLIEVKKNYDPNNIIYFNLYFDTGEKKFYFINDQSINENEQKRIPVSNKFLSLLGDNRDNIYLIKNQKDNNNNNMNKVCFLPSKETIDELSKELTRESFQYQNDTRIIKVVSSAAFFWIFLICIIFFHTWTSVAYGLLSLIFSSISCGLYLSATDKLEKEYKDKLLEFLNSSLIDYNIEEIYNSKLEIDIYSKQNIDFLHTRFSEQKEMDTNNVIKKN